MKVNIKNFKCFEDLILDFPRLTILAGSNGGGKSSVIQALLLYKIAVEKGVFQKGTGSLTSIKLHHKYKLEMGSPFLLAKLKEEPFAVSVEGNTVEFSIPEKKNELKLNANPTRFGENEPFSGKFHYYLSSERNGPRHIQELKHMGYNFCGFSGEYTGQVLLNCQYDEVDKKRLFQLDSSRLDQLLDQTNDWLSFIFPGVKVKPEEVGAVNCRIVLSNSLTPQYVSAPNLGFGISYCLPILVTGLIAEENSYFIVENPEAHLHPQAQSRLGYFLGQIAASAVNIIVETHSEHIINGMRLAYATESIGLKKEDFKCYFFPGFEGGDIHIDNPVSIFFEENGSLHPYPKNFFDQVGQDMLELMRLKPDM